MAKGKGPWVRGWRRDPDGKPTPFRRVWVSMNQRSIGKRAIKIATKDIGYKESPPNSNSNKFGKLWGENGVPWCGLAVARWWQQAGFNVTKALALKIDYVPELVKLATHGQHKLRLVGASRVRAGDAVAYDFPRKDGTADHVGLFERWIDRKAGSFYAIEGNTGRTNQSNGGEVLRQRRHLSDVQAFVRKLPG